MELPSFGLADVLVSVGVLLMVADPAKLFAIAHRLLHIFSLM